MKIIQPVTQQDFEQYYELRWRVLRKPWQQEKGSEKDEDEDSSFHLMVIDKGNTVGVARLQNVSPTEAQIRYMAVDENNNGQGIGRAIMKSMEDHARKNHIH